MKVKHRHVLKRRRRRILRMSFYNMNKILVLRWFYFTSAQLLCCLMSLTIKQVYSHFSLSHDKQQQTVCLVATDTQKRLRAREWTHSNILQDLWPKNYTGPPPLFQAQGWTHQIKMSGMHVSVKLICTQSWKASAQTAAAATVCYTCL